MAPNENSDLNDLALERELAQLKQEYEQLNTKKLQTEMNLKHLEESLAELKTQAREAFGTEDPDELEKLLEQKRKENAKLVAEYREHIQGIQQNLAKVEEDV